MTSIVTQCAVTQISAIFLLKKRGDISKMIFAVINLMPKVMLI